MLEFAPRWTTPAGNIDDNTPIVDGRLLSRQLRVEDVAVQEVVITPLVQLRFRGLIRDLKAVLVDGVALPQGRYSVAGNVLGITFGNQTGKVTIEVQRQSAIAFTVISGSLPSGVGVSRTGLMSGLAVDIKSGTTPYEFTVRANNGKKSRDRTFSLSTVGGQVEQVIVKSLLPSLQTDASNTFDYYDFGSYARAEGVLKTVELSMGVRSLVVRPTGQRGQFIEGLPGGLSLRNNSIIGTVDANLPAGRYVFRLSIGGQSATPQSSILGQIRILDDLAVYIERPTVIDWITPAGTLGTIDEGYPSAFAVQARHSTGGITYSIVPGTSPLPSGMRINVKTGDIEGIAPHVNRDTTYRIAVRATRSGNFVDRVFGFTIRSRYTTDAVVDVRLKLRQLDQAPMLLRYVADIPAKNLYRPDDPSFGLLAEPFFYLVKGINAATFDQALKGRATDAITTATDYHGAMELVLGQHRFATVVGQSGEIIYEVIYREVVDPIAKAGGFSFTSKEVIEEKVIHAQTGKIVYATSIRNARYDLVRDCGFPSADSNLADKIGLNTAESLPKWMTSPQSDGNPIGFTSAFAIAYVKPNTAATIVNQLNRDTRLPPVGRQVTFDRYYLYEIAYSAITTFDIEATTFDGGRKFDFAVTSNEKTVQV